MSPTTAKLCERGATKINTSFRNAVRSILNFLKQRVASASASATFLWLTNTNISPVVRFSAFAIAERILSRSTAFRKWRVLMDLSSPSATRATASTVASASGKTAAISATAASGKTASSTTKPATANPPTASGPPRPGGIHRSSAGRPYPRNTYYCEDHKEDNQIQKTLLVMPGPGPNVRYRSAITGILATSCSNHRVDPCSQAAIKIPRSKTRCDLIGNDALTDSIGQSALQTVAGLYSQHFVLYKHEQDCAVVAIPLSRLPCPERILRKVFKRCVRRQTGVDNDENLIRGLALKVGKLLIQPLGGFRTHQIGEIVEIPRRFWRYFGRRRTKRQKYKNDREHGARGEVSHNPLPAAHYSAIGWWNGFGQMHNQIYAHMDLSASAVPLFWAGG